MSSESAKPPAPDVIELQRWKRSTTKRAIEEIRMPQIYGGAVLDCHNGMVLMFIPLPTPVMIHPTISCAMRNDASKRQRSQA